MSPITLHKTSMCWNTFLSFEQLKPVDCERFHVYFLLRYPIGNIQLPHFKVWVQKMLEVDLSSKISPQAMPATYSTPILSSGFVEAIKSAGIEHSVQGIDRLVRAHGHTLREIYLLQQGSFQRIPDIVVWPSRFFSYTHSCH